jgi:hypothetical protein
MIEITDRVVDETYQRGIAALVADAPRRAIEPGHRRVPILVAIAGVAIPLAALAAAAFVVIAGHVQRPEAHAVPTTPATATSPPSTTAALGQTIHIDEGNGSGVDVTVEKVVFAPGSPTFEPPPVDGLDAAATVLISNPAGGVIQSYDAHYIVDFLDLHQLEAQLQAAIVANDAARISLLHVRIASSASKPAALSVEPQPINFEYVTNGGQAYPACGGSSAASAFVSNVSVGAPPDVVTDNGRTSLTVVFDVPSRGGLIQMTDALGKVIGRWLVPAA